MTSSILTESIFPMFGRVYDYPKRPSLDRRITLNPKRPNVTGTSGNDTFIANKGNYTIDGGNGNDTIDYSLLGQGVTIGAKGIITKGKLGIDTVKNIERIIGAIGKTNTIDGNATNGTMASLNIDFAKNSFTVENLPGGAPNQVFDIFNFNQAIGTNNNDTMVGNNSGNCFIGGGGNDIITGGTGNDILNGTDSNARGVGEVDILTGAGGVNTFILGDKTGAFYLGNGDSDYAFITDYDLTSDRIQLGAGKTDQLCYQLENTGIIDIFVGQQNGSEDLIAKVQLKNSFSTSYGKSPMGIGSNQMSVVGINENGEFTFSTPAISQNLQLTDTIFA